mmetsp:Transcript_8475/g.24884  ORF Transcript_8475/g.24884 Transcript_8475/m.24884 type:complete len:275 (-) Transcript_8475:99-923(-)
MLAEWARCSVRGEWLQLMMAHSDTLRLPDLILGNWRGRSIRAPRIDPGFRAYLDKKYHKVVLVVDFIASSGAVGAEAVVLACEVFASGSARQWLKVAGDAKAELIDCCLESQPWHGRSIVTEFGCFVGYSCVRMAWRLGGLTRVLSLESDAIHVLLARHVITEARQSQVVETVSGMAHDATARLGDDWGSQSACFAFMDHRGTRFHVELAHLEKTWALGPAAKFLADNTLKPGAPLSLWHFSCNRTQHSATSWSLPEFISESCEDWMTASDCRP